LSWSNFCVSFQSRSVWQGCRLVASGELFLMNRQVRDSLDGRYWGFVPDSHLRGKAFFIWFNWDDISSFAFKRVFRGIQ